MNRKIGIIIQARVGSTRLPNKMLLPFYAEQSILEIIIERLKNNLNLPIILATTTHSQDNQLKEVVRMYGIECFRGSESDVLQRFINAAECFKIDVIVRVCADNPFLSPEYIRQLVSSFQKQEADYISFKTEEGVPSIKTHYGFFAELVKLESLKKIAESTNDLSCHEHITKYIYENTNRFKINFLNIPFKENKMVRLTIDTPEDYEMAQTIFKHLKESKQSVEPPIVLEYLSNQKQYLELMYNQILLQQK